LAEVFEEHVGGGFMRRSGWRGGAAIGHGRHRWRRRHRH
jgi:hypothetical protein